MYYPHFGLKEAPFKITPNTDFFFKGGQRGAILEALVYAISNGEGIIKVVGEVGSGKTMLCRMLQKILPEHIESIYLAIPSVEPEHVLHAIAFELQLKLPKNADRLKVMQLLQSYLVNKHSQGHQVVIFVEEAQGMPLATLEEIRLLSNLETKQDKLLQIVLFGQPELDSNLNELDIRQLRERITHSFYLGPLQKQDISEYLIFRLRAAGYFGPHLFNDAAIQRLAKASEGLVRRVNILADKSLLSAFSEDVYQVTPKHVKAAIQDSEFGRTKNQFKPYIYIIFLLVTSLVGLISLMLWQQHQAKQIAIKEKMAIIPIKKFTKPVEKPIEVQPTSPNISGASMQSNAQTSVAVQSVSYSDIKQKNLKDRIEATNNSLLKLPPETFTIQMMTSADDDQLKIEFDRLSQKFDLSNLYVYQLKQANSAQAIILYGAFSSRDEAQEVLKTLPTHIQNKKPFLRNLASIQQNQASQ